MGEVFGRLGIPVVFESGQALDRSPALRALAALVQLDLDDWPFDQLLAVLGSNYFQPDLARVARAAPRPPSSGRFADCKFPAGAAIAPATRRGRRRLQSPIGVGRRLLRGSARRRFLQRATFAVVKRLARAARCLAPAGHAARLGQAWQRLAQETGLLRAMDGNGDEGRRAEGGGRKRKHREEGGRQSAVNQQSEINNHNQPSALRLPPSAFPSSSDRRAWNRLMEVRPPPTAGRLALPAPARTGPPRGPRDAAGYPPQRTRGTCGRRIGLGARALGRPASARFAFPICFWPGFPRRSFRRPSARTASTARPSMLRLIDAGLPLVARTERTREEMLLFYEAITRAGKRLYLSYPRWTTRHNRCCPARCCGRLNRRSAENRNSAHRADRFESDPARRRAALRGRVPRKAMATALQATWPCWPDCFKGRAEGGRRRAEGGRGSGQQRRKPNSETEIPSPPSTLSPLPLPSSLSAWPPAWS